MAITIQSIMPKSLAAAYNIMPGERLVSVNGLPVRDFLDLEFYTSDYEFELELLDANGKSRQVLIQREHGRSLGIEPEPYTVRECNNSCIFCFIDQMPPNLRDSLYGKDDDYLFSFVFGNYITLSNLSEADYQRIMQQRITPIYVSLHTTDNALRQKMMRSATQVDALAMLMRLSAAGIKFHIQIVCVPGYNDGEELRKSLCELLEAKINLLSIGIVPVGLTQFRDKLCKLTTFNASSALKTLEIISDVRSTYGSKIIFPADEFFVQANQPIPAEEYYEDYPQLENGIGMLRLCLQIFRSKKRALLKELRKKPANYLMISSISALGTISQIAAELNLRLENQSIRVQVIRNDFFGPQISVCGLLTYSDLKNQLHPEENEVIILPNCIFNTNGETLDGASRLTVKSTWPNPILLIDQFFEDWDYM
ncbi:MAG: DUF512 domain-containing protein [Candidatus Cloacimonas sp.]|jgi:putative radical SAM enzyme (TIGR03279 family)|nr:DUF512 domain-containing protein [Candidatus Cloacimonas sp.]